jgi:transposase InsO family protein
MARASTHDIDRFQLMSYPHLSVRGSSRFFGASHSPSFDQRRRPDTLRTAMATAFRVSPVLAMEVALSGRQTEGPARNPSIDPEYEPRQPALGRPRIYGELLKLGIDVGQTSAAKYMARHRRPPSQEWRTFLRNHAEGIAAMDLFAVPTLSFRFLYGLLILNHGRRQILSLGVTAHPTAEWIARQLTAACGWDGTPEYLVRDHDSVYGAILTRRVWAMGIRDRPIAPRSPWQNGHAERLIGSLRGNVLTMSSSLASGTCVYCSFCTWTITTKRGHTYP